MQHEAYVVVIVLNWNAREETLACLAALAATDWPNMATIVVDNGSSENIEADLREQHVGTLLLCNEENLGFAGGMNTGMRAALKLDADYVLLLNNDTEVDPGMVRRLVEVAEARPDAGIVSPVEFFRDARSTVSSAGLRCNLRRGYQGPPLRMGERDRGQLTGVTKVDSTSGAAMLVPTSVLREVGMLDETLFLYSEDVDWSMRMRAAGRGVYVALDARLWHGRSISSGGQDSPVVTYYHARNAFVVCARHAPMGWLRGTVRHTEILFANLLHALRCRRPFANVRAVLAARRDYRDGRLGQRDRGLALTDSKN